MELLYVVYFDALTTFSVTSGTKERKKKRKATQKHAKTCIKRGVFQHLVISTSQRRAEHPFAGQNTQQLYCNIIIIIIIFQWLFFGH